MKDSAMFDTSSTKKR